MWHTAVLLHAIYSLPTPNLLTQKLWDEAQHSYLTFPASDCDICSSLTTPAIDALPLISKKKSKPLRVMSLNLLSIGSHTQEDPSAYHMTACSIHLWKEKSPDFESRQAGDTCYRGAGWCPILQLTSSGLIHERTGHRCWREDKGEWAINTPNPLPYKLCVLS